MNKILYTGFLLTIILISGCVQEKALTVVSAETYCVSSETGTNMSLSEARKIATNSEFGDQGTLKDTYSCNEGTSTWWIDMRPMIEKPGCSPAYVINVNTKTVEINWRCTGVIPQTNESLNI